MDNPDYVGLLRVEKEAKALTFGGIAVTVAAGLYLFVARKPVNLPPTNPDAPRESN
jgi:hypothetical protein